MWVFFVVYLPTVLILTIVSIRYILEKKERSKEWGQMEVTKEAFFQDVLDNVRNISIRDLILDKYELQPGLCPFHNDRTAGSFSVVERFGRYKCWSCQAEGDGIDFVRETEKIGFQQAVFKIALLYDIVTPEQINKFFSDKGFKTEDAKVIRSYENLWKHEVEEKRASQDIIHSVFELFSKGESIIEGKTDKLSEAHRKHLKEERGLSDEEIERVGYFTIPSRSSRYLKYFLMELKELEHIFETDGRILEGVPGFYKKKGDTSKRAYTFLSKKGIGIPVRNAEGTILGIQIRKDVAKKGESRYIWMSSSFANDEEDLEHGTGSGSPIHVSYPEENHYKDLLIITEGIFKSEAIAKEYKSIALSIQGVNSWKNELMETIKELERKENHSFNQIMIMFDADISSNVYVFEAMEQMVEELEYYGKSIHYAWWDKDYGKGIDDVIKSGYQSQVKKMSAVKFVEEYRAIVDEMEKREHMKIREILLRDGNDEIEEQFDMKIKPLFYL